MKHDNFCQPFVVFCSFGTGTRVKISDETPVNTFFLACRYSEKRNSPCIRVIGARSCRTISLKGDKQQSRWLHNEDRCNHFKKYIVTFSFISINRRCNQQLPPVTFWKVDLFAIAKWLLSPLFCVSTGLIVASL